MDQHRRQWGIPPWAYRPMPPRLDTADHRNADVVVVGGGLTGCSAAYHLARAGVRVLVLDAGLIADGASGRTGGIVLEGSAAGSLEGADDCVKGLKRIVSREAIDCGLRLPGCWEIVHLESESDRTEKELPWIDDCKCVAIKGLVSGGVVEPSKLNRGLAEAALRAGASIRENMAVTRIDAGRPPSLEVRGQTLRPGWIIVASNAWITSLMRELGSLRSSLTFACATEPLAEDIIGEIGLGAGIPFYTVDLPYLWGRITDEGHAIFGSGLLFGEPNVLEETSFESQSFRSPLESLQKRVRGLHPALRDVRFSHSWGGPIAFTTNQRPLVREIPESKGLLVGGGYSGHGIAISVRVGELLARRITHNQPLPVWSANAR